MDETSYSKLVSIIDVAALKPLISCNDVRQAPFYLKPILGNRLYFILQKKFEQDIHKELNIQNTYYNVLQINATDINSTKIEAKTWHSDAASHKNSSF